MLRELSRAVSAQRFAMTLHSLSSVTPLLRASVCGCVFSVSVQRAGDRVVLRMGSFITS